jgi:hypothetical protein
MAMKKIIPLLALLVVLGTNTAAAENCIGDCINGKGTLKYRDGGKYVGEWKNSKEEGRGTYTKKLFTRLT